MSPFAVPSISRSSGPAGLSTPLNHSRRQLARGLAWTVPAVAVGLAAPAVAASACPGGCPNLSFGTVSNVNGCATTVSATMPNGWTTGSNVAIGPCTPAPNGVSRWQPGYYTTGSAITCAPQFTSLMYTELGYTGNGSFMWIQKPICLAAGVTYTFCFSYLLRIVNIDTLYLVPGIYSSAASTTSLTPSWRQPSRGTGSIGSPGTAPGGTFWNSSGVIASGTTVQVSGNNGLFPGAFYACNSGAYWAIHGTYCESYTAPSTATYYLRLAWAMTQQSGGVTGSSGGWAQPTVTCS